MRKTIIAASSLALIAGGVAAASGQSTDELILPGIHAMISSNHTLTAGGGDFYPVVNQLVGSHADIANIIITSGTGEVYPVVEKDGMQYVDGNLSYKNTYFITSPGSPNAMPIPLMLQGPMDVGHINFASASFAIDSNDKLILNAMADEIAKTGLKGIYMVGKADSVGSYESNMLISEKRVNAAMQYLENRLNSIGVTDFSIRTEYMGDLVSKSKADSEDRRVEVMLYPVI